MRLHLFLDAQKSRFSHDAAQMTFKMTYFLFQMFPEGQNFNGHPENMHPFVNNNDIISKYMLYLFVLSHKCTYSHFIGKT